MLLTRRSERILAEFGVDLMVAEPVYRERMEADEKPHPFTLIERQGLLALGTMWKERLEDDSTLDRPAAGA